MLELPKHILVIQFQHEGKTLPGGNFILQ